MEFGDVRTSTDLQRFSHPHRHESYSREEESRDLEEHLRREHFLYGRDINSPYMENSYHHHHQQAAAAAATAAPPFGDHSSFYRPLSRGSSPNLQYNLDMTFETQDCTQHPWGGSRSVSSLSNSSCGSDSDTGGVAMMKSSAPSSPMGSHRSLNNDDYSQTDSGASSGRMSMEADDGFQDWNSATPTDEELSEVFALVDENKDGLVCGSDLRGFMSRVLAFEMSEDEAEKLLLFYGNGRTLGAENHHTSPGGRQRNGGAGGAVVGFEGFLSLYQCLCGEPASPEEQSMMAEAACQVFDTTQLHSG
ncbi:unnamed protein product [Calypogeia fissa]